MQQSLASDCTIKRVTAPILQYRARHPKVDDKKKTGTTTVHVNNHGHRGRKIRSA